MQKTNNKNDCIYLSGIAKEAEGYIWMSLLEANGLVQIDINTGIAQFVDCFKDETQEYQLHTQIVVYKNKMFFIPWNSINIAIYEFEKSALRYVICNNKSPGRFVSGIQDGQYLYMISEDSHRIVKFDMDKERIIDIYELKGLGQVEEFLGHVMPLKTDGYLWKITGNNKGTWKFDLQNNRYLLQENLFQQEIRLIAGCVKDNFIWLLADNDIVYQLSESGMYINQYDLSTVMNFIFKDEKRESLNCIFLDHEFYIIFYGKNCIVKIPFFEGKFIVNESQYQNFENPLFYINDKALTIISSNKFLFINESGKKEYVFRVSSNFYDIYIMKRKDIINENKFYNMGLESYIESLCKRKENLLSNKELSDISIGKSIIDVCRGLK